MTQEVPLLVPPSRTTVARAYAEVLVIDDDRHFRELARNLLESDGVRVLEAKGVSEGLAHLRDERKHVDAIILDLVLPDIDGIEALRQLKAAFPGLKIVTVSGADASDLYLSISARLGADASLAKAQVEKLPGLLMEVINR